MNLIKVGVSEFRKNLFELIKATKKEDALQVMSQGVDKTKVLLNYDRFNELIQYEMFYKAQKNESISIINQRSYEEFFPSLVEKKVQGASSKPAKKTTAPVKKKPVKVEKIYNKKYDTLKEALNDYRNLGKRWNIYKRPTAERVQRAKEIDASADVGVCDVCRAIYKAPNKLELGGEHLVCDECFRMYIRDGGVV
jgi:hypothetical protein